MSVSLFSYFLFLVVNSNSSGCSHVGSLFTSEDQRTELAHDIFAAFAAHASFIMMSLIQTTGCKMAPLTVELSQLSNVSFFFNKQDQKSCEKTAMCVCWK